MPGVLSRHLRGALLVASCLLLILSGGVAPLASGQDPPDRSSPTAAAPDPDTPRFRAEANFVRVDVYATRNGVAVRDLQAEDFAVVEDGVPQRIETFEHVEILGSVPQETRREPQTPAEGRGLAENSRARVFVVFLDTYHTDVIGSHYMRRAVGHMLERLVGPDDVFAVMTPQMSARDLAFARRTDTIAGMLERHWAWGQEGQAVKTEPEEQEYLTCYPTVSPVGFGFRPGEGCTDCGVAGEMIARRRELRTLTALDDLAMILRGVREERKAVITITSGWRLFRPNPQLVANMAPPPIRSTGVDPSGRLSDEPHTIGYGSARKCAADQIMLSELDNNQYLHEILDRANRANVSFYPVDAQGLRSWNSDLGSQPIGAPASYEREVLAHRLDTLRLLAGATDGLAVINTNDFDRGMRRIVDDLTSYYLLGYYSSNSSYDGRFRSIKVKVNRPGVEVRARRGYAAPRHEEIERARLQATSAAAAAPPGAVQSALLALTGLRREARVFSHVTWAAPPGGNGSGGRVWVTAQLDQATARLTEWTRGGTADVLIMNSHGETIAAGRQPLVSSARAASISIADVPLRPGEYRVQVRLAPSASGAPVGDTVDFRIPGSDASVGPPRLMRRAATTGPEFAVTANPAFRRSEQLQVEVPVLGSADRVEAELLDRNGNRMPVPVQARLQSAPEGGPMRALAELALAPLAPGDYLVRTIVHNDNHRQESLAAFRMVP